MTDICLAPNSPGAMAVARAYRDRECVLLCDGRPSYWCKHDPRKADRWNDIASIERWDGWDADIG